MKEIWKDIKDYDGFYKISNCGMVKSLDRVLVYNNKGRMIKRKFDGQLLKLRIDKKGYVRVMLVKHQHYKLAQIHRLMAIAFLPIPEHLKHLPLDKLQVNHVDENKENNFIYINEDGSVDYEKSNLEWCTAKYNHNYGTRVKRAAEKQINSPERSTPVKQYTLDGEFIDEYPSIAEAGRITGVHRGNISLNCQNKRPSAGGYKWSYA